METPHLDHTMLMHTLETSEFTPRDPLSLASILLLQIDAVDINAIMSII